MDIDEQFQEIYDKVSNVINAGACHEIVFEDIDRVISIIWNREGSTGAIFDSLTSKEDKKVFIKNFQSASDWLMGWNRDDLTEDDLQNLAKTIKME
jgi:hypothetical protein